MPIPMMEITPLELTYRNVFGALRFSFSINLNRKLNIFRFPQIQSPLHTFVFILKDYFLLPLPLTFSFFYGNLVTSVARPDILQPPFPSLTLLLIHHHHLLGWR